MAPTLIQEPVAYGEATIGNTIKVSNGTWSGAPTFTYQWQNSPDLVTWTNIVGKNNNSYSVQASDQNKYLRCNVTATQSGATTAASSFAGPVLYLGFVCQLSTANPNGVQTWNDITPYVMNFTITRARQRTLMRFEAGTMDLELNNADRRFDASYTNSPYYPNLLPLREIRFGFVVNGVTYWEYTGYVERWPQIYQGPTKSTVQITCVDGFELVTNHYLSSVYASYTTALSGSNNDLTFTSTSLGYAGNTTSITYVVSGINTPLTVSVGGPLGEDVTVNVATDGSGNATSTALQVQGIVNSDPVASTLLIATVATSNTGAGVVAAMSQQFLTGGTYIQQLSGSYISQIFSFIGWAEGTVINPGVSMVQAQALPNDGSVHALDQIYDAVQTELGQFFFDTQNRPTFLDRTALSSSAYQTSMMTLSDNPNGTTTFGYQNISPTLDKDLIYNDVRVTRNNGTVQILDDSTSDTQYFTRTLGISNVLNINDMEANLLGQALLLEYKQPQLRWEPIVLTPGQNITFWQKLVSLDLIDLVTINRTPPGAGQVIFGTVSIIGITITGQAGPVSNIQWTLTVDPVNNNPFFLLNDAVHGVLNTSQIGY